MNEIWANRLTAGDKTWPDVPDARRDGVRKALAARVEGGTLTPEDFAALTGETPDASAQ